MSSFVPMGWSLESCCSTPGGKHLVLPERSFAYPSPRGEWMSSQHFLLYPGFSELNRSVSAEESDAFLACGQCCNTIIKH